MLSIFCILPLVFVFGNVSRAQVPQPISTNIFDQLAASSPVIATPPIVTATAAFDPPVVAPGEKAVYRVTFNASEESVHWPADIPAPPRLKIRRTASGESKQIVAGAIMAFASFDFDVRASAAGRFTIPERVVDVSDKPVTVPAATLNVQAHITGDHEPARQLLIEPATTNVFVGQPLEVKVLLPGSPTHPVEGVSQVQLNGDGFVTEKTGLRASIRPLERNGRTATTFIYETTITPIAAGDLAVSAQGFSSGMQFGLPVVISGQISIPGGQPRYVLLDSEPVAIHVRPLPTDSEPPGFSGAIGSFLLAAPTLSTNLVRVGDPVQLTAIVSGNGNLNRINPPPPPRVEGWQIFAADRLGIIADPKAGVSGAGFRYTLIPTTVNVHQTPAIPFSCFDPERAAFANLTIPPMPITVVPGETSASEDTFAASESAPDDEKKARLSKLAESPGRTAASLVPLQMCAWMPAVQLSPALAICGLWLWDRRRRFLEQHPDLVRRRHARRALRRQMRELRLAEEAGDVKRFAVCAVTAMRIASAPHFPAEPRALVCADVLEVLGPEERNGRAGEVVRKFFNASDADRFAVAPLTGVELLNETDSLRQVLATLEGRL